MNPSAEKQAQWLMELEELVEAIDDGRIPTSRRVEWLSTIRKNLDHLRDQIFLHDHFPENQELFCRVERNFTAVKAVKSSGSV